MKPEIIRSTNFINDAVSLVEQAAAEAIAARGEFRIALSGGNTPKPIYHALASASHDWAKWLFTFGDERCVPPDSEDSNYHMAAKSLFEPGSVPARSILRMKGEIDPAEAAREYEAELKARAAGEPIFRHDLLLLGMGPDGHTASLFPGTPALTVTDRLVVENYVPKVSMWRLTMTYPLLNAARHVCFLASAKGKESMLEDVFSGASSHPCAAVQPADGRLTWLVGE